MCVGHFKTKTCVLFTKSVSTIQFKQMLNVMKYFVTLIIFIANAFIRFIHKTMLFWSQLGTITGKQMLKILF